MKRLAGAISFILILINLSQAQNTTMENITCRQAFDLMQKHITDTNFIILDLRTEEMYNEEHIEHAIYYDVFSEDFEDWAGKLERDKLYLLYCNVGHRSGIALDMMREMGFRKLYHLHEGIIEWKEQGFETVREE